MKRLWIEISILLAAFLTFVIALEYIYSQEENLIDSVYNYIRGHKNSNTKIVIVGNSHMGPLRNHNCLNIDKEQILNISIGGQDLFHSYFIIKELLINMPNIEYIFLGLDYEQMGYSLSTTNQKHIARQYYKYTDTLEDMSLTNLIQAKSNFFRANRDISLLQNFFYKNFVWKKNKNNTEEIIPNTQKRKLENFIPVTTENLNSVSLCKKRAKELSVIKFSEKMLEPNKDNLLKIIKLVTTHNKKLVIIVPPKRKCFYDFVNLNNIDKGKKAIYELIINMPSNVIFLDYYGDNNFDDSLFIDPDHLNTLGAKKLFETIERDILSKKANH